MKRQICRKFCLQLAVPGNFFLQLYKMCASTFNAVDPQLQMYREYNNETMLSMTNKRW